MSQDSDLLLWFDELGIEDVPLVGGKNASLGEMICHLKDHGIQVPEGFATTADAFRLFLSEAGLSERIRKAMDECDRGVSRLEDAGRHVRESIAMAELPSKLSEALCEAYRELGRRCGEKDLAVAVRSSATAEDLPDASFAGQQESFLNVRGEDALCDAVRRCYASLYTNRAISYRQERGFDHMAVALSVGVQRMVRSDTGASGVMFTIDTETGFPDLVLVDGSWGLGESIVQGAVEPDEFRVFKPPLNDPSLRPIIEKHCGQKETMVVYASDAGDDSTRTVDTPDEMRNRFCIDDDTVLALARWAVAIENHYTRPMDIEWALDGETGEMFVVQARPETVESQRKGGSLQTYRLLEEGEAVVRGQAIGTAIAAGKAFVIHDLAEAGRFEDGGVLVTDRTDPDWVPLMRRAAGIVTDHGGRTSHAAIVSRELGVAAIVGCGNATNSIDDGTEVTVSCAGGETGSVYIGRLNFEQEDVDLSDVPKTRTKVMMNMASPEAACRWWALPVDGIGLARMEFIINNAIKVHPLALTRYEQVEDSDARRQIDTLAAGYEDRTQFFVDRLACGIAAIAASRYPDPVVVRLSDFKTNEYANLIGGHQFEPHEENPMIGWRGASRYYSDGYRDGFALECRAFKRAREVLGLTNIIAMVPFCRTPEEGKRVLDEMAANGLERGQNGFQVYVMAEIPCNVVLVDRFAELFDGFSIGSNDLTQLTLGVDRDSTALQELFNDRHEAIQRMIRQLIVTAHDYGRPVGLCGQAPSDHPEFAAFLVEAGIDSISVNPDSAIAVRRIVAEAEAAIRPEQSV